MLKTANLYRRRGRKSIYSKIVKKVFILLCLIGDDKFRVIFVKVLSFIYFLVDIL